MKTPDIKWTPEVADIARRLYEAVKEVPGAPGVASMRAQRVRRLGTETPAVWRAIPDDNKRAKLFEAACSGGVGVVTRREIAEEIDRCNKLAGDLRRATSFLPPNKIQAALDIAEDIEQAARKLASYTGPRVIEKFSPKLWIRGYVLELSEAFTKALGSPHDKLVAKIVTVALDLSKPLPESTVRSWRTYNPKQAAEN